MNAKSIMMSGRLRAFFMGLLSLAVASVLSCSPENAENGPSDTDKDDSEEPAPEADSFGLLLCKARQAESSPYKAYVEP